MKTKLLVALLLGFVLHLNLNADDASNPCGALLCILGGQTGGECKKYYKYYAYELPKKCYGNAACIAEKQLSHLKNCKMANAPEGAAKIDDELANSLGVTDFMSDLDNTMNKAKGITEECSAQILNNRVEKVILRVERICRPSNCYNEEYCDCWNVNIWGFRINPEMTRSCKVLSQMKYTTLKLKYTCNNTFYEEQDWNNGYTKLKISKQEYDNLGDSEKSAEIIKVYVGMRPKDEIRYYQKIPIKKNCWIDEANNE